jgi:hypothetical protein
MRDIIHTKEKCKLKRWAKNTSLSSRSSSPTTKQQKLFGFDLVMCVSLEPRTLCRWRGDTREQYNIILLHGLCFCLFCCFEFIERRGQSFFLVLTHPLPQKNVITYRTAFLLAFTLKYPRLEQIV